MPYWRVATRALANGATETRRTFTLGIPSSPLLLVEESKSTPVRVVRPDGGETLEGESHHRAVKLEFVCWSMLSMILGTVLIDGPRWWRSVFKSSSRR
jgi:hypothetical protein